MQIDQVARSMLAREHTAKHVPAGSQDPDCWPCHDDRIRELFTVVSAPWPLTEQEARTYTATIHEKAILCD